MAIGRIRLTGEELRKALGWVENTRILGSTDLIGDGTVELLISHPDIPQIDNLEDYPLTFAFNVDGDHLGFGAVAVARLEEIGRSLCPK